MGVVGDGKRESGDGVAGCSTREVIDPDLEGSWIRDLRGGYRYAQLRAADEVYRGECSVHRDDRARSEARAVKGQRKTRTPRNGCGWAQAGKSERRRNGVVVGGDENFVGHGQRLRGGGSTEVVLPSSEDPAGVGSFGEGEDRARGIETVSAGRDGTYVDGAGASFVDVVSDEELGREVRGVGGASGRENNGIGGGRGAVAPVVEGIAAVEAVGFFGVIHAERVRAAGSPCGIVEHREVLGRVGKVAVAVRADEEVRAEGVGGDVYRVDGIGRELDGSVDGETGVGNIESLGIGAETTRKKEGCVVELVEILPRIRSGGERDLLAGDVKDKRGSRLPDRPCLQSGGAQF